MAAYGRPRGRRAIWRRCAERGQRRADGHQWSQGGHLPPRGCHRRSGYPRASSGKLAHPGPVQPADPVHRQGPGADGQLRYAGTGTQGRHPAPGRRQAHPDPAGRCRRGLPPGRAPARPAGRRGRTTGRHPDETGRRAGRPAGGRHLPRHGVPGGHLPHAADPGDPVQQPVPEPAGALGHRPVHRRRAARPAVQRPVVRHRHGRHGPDRAGRHRGQQQHHPDRHLQPAAPPGPATLRGRAGMRQPAPTPGAADGSDNGAGSGADGDWGERRPARPEPRHRRTLDPVVDADVQRHCRWSDLRYRPHAAADTLPAAARLAL